jgi:beta-fructofuranosidase
MDPKGRQIMWGWLTDFLDDDLTRGWSGVFGLPRVLWLGKDGTLRMAPVEEMKALRYNGRNYPSTMLHDGVRVELDGINGESSEIRFSIDPATSRRVGIKVRTSPNEEETTLLYYDAETGELVYDATASGGKGTKLKETAPFRLAPGERLELDVFIDRSVLEIFANDRQAITRRVYPARADSTGVYLFCEGGEAFVGDIETWEMMPSNPY